MKVYGQNSSITSSSSCSAATATDGACGGEIETVDKIGCGEAEPPGGGAGVVAGRRPVAEELPPKMRNIGEKISESTDLSPATAWSAGVAYTVVATDRLCRGLCVAKLGITPLESGLNGSRPCVSRVLSPPGDHNILERELKIDEEDEERPAGRLACGVPII